MIGLRISFYGYDALKVFPLKRNPFSTKALSRVLTLFGVEIKSIT